MLPPENQELETTTTTTTTSTATQDLNKCDPTTTTTTMNEPMNMFTDEYDVDSTCSTPYVSAPSSPGRGHGTGAPIAGFYYSAPASPMHFILSTAAAGGAMSDSSSNNLEISTSSSTHSFEFDFSSASKNSTNGTSSTGSSMSSADELFLNGQIRPMKLSSHLQRPQVLAPLLDLDEAADDEVNEVDRGRAVKMRDRSLRRRTRSMSPMRTTPFGWHDDDEDNLVLDGSEAFLEEKKKKLEEKDAAASGETTPCESGASSRSSSVGRSSSRWIFLKEFLYRSKSEGRNNGHKFWGSLSFSPVKDKIKTEKVMPSKFPSKFSKEKTSKSTTTSATLPSDIPPASESSAGLNGSEGKRVKQSGLKDVKKKAVNGVGKRRVPPSPHELHYTAYRAQAEEMRKKTFLPYRQGLLGCLGFSSKSYGAMNGFARALNPVSSRDREVSFCLSQKHTFSAEL